MEKGITREQILNEIIRSPHGDLKQYQPIIEPACKQDPEFVARLIAYDFTNGQIKDSKIALPIISLASREFPDELADNSLAHIAMQPPREALRALKFAIAMGMSARRQRRLENMLRVYLRQKEQIPGKWMPIAVRHRRALKSLYSLCHAKDVPVWVSDILFGFHKNPTGDKVVVPYAPGSVFADIANLSKQPPEVVAATIQKWHLSPLVVTGAMAGAKAAQENSAVVQSSVAQMSDTELVTRAASIEKKGLARDAALKETVRKRVAKAKTSNRATLKTGIAADEVEDESLKTMLKELQERQIESQKAAGRGIDGNWLVIVDKSSSQEIAIDVGKHIAAAVAKFVTGRVWLAFCDTGCAAKEVTGKTLEEIQSDSRFVVASGGTSYGVALEWAISRGIEVDGVVVVGDAGECNPPHLSDMLLKYAARFQKEPPVYLYKTFCGPEYSHLTRNFAMFMEHARLAYTTFDLTHGKVDYYALPNLVQTMNVSRFGVVDKIMACPLVKLETVLPILATVAAAGKEKLTCSKS